jgi:hypothetical protein
MTSYQTRRLAGRKQLSLIVKNPVYQLFAKKPMSASLQTTQALDARLSFDQAVAGLATNNDRETLAGVANCITVLAEKHCTKDDLEVAQEAQKAILRADVRLIDGDEKWQFDDDGKRSMLAAMDVFEQMVAVIGHGAVSAALVEVIERTARRQVHRLKAAA